MSSNLDKLIERMAEGKIDWGYGDSQQMQVDAQAHLEMIRHYQAMSKWAAVLYVWLLKIVKQPWVPKEIVQKAWSFCRLYPGKENVSIIS
jgi:hypothetical protein